MRRRWGAVCSMPCCISGGGGEGDAVAAQLEFMARLAGVEAMSFETIVASGERSALPHGRATEAKLPAGAL